MLEHSDVATRLPVQDLERAADIEATVAALRLRGVAFEEYDLPGLKTVNGVAQIAGNYPSKGTGEKGAWFKDSEGNLVGIGQPVR